MISVIIPTYNSEKKIYFTLKALLNQNFPKNKYEIIVVDDGSSDKTIEVIKKFKNVKLIKQCHRGPASARNLGGKKAKGDILLFIDSDCVPDKTWIKNMIEPLKDKKIVGVGGTYRTLNKENLIARFVGYEIDIRYERMKKQKNIDFIGTYSAAYRKDIFLKFGGFDEDFPTASGEDPELSYRIAIAGYKMVFQPKAFVFHSHPDTLTKYLRQKFWRAYWKILLYSKHKKKILGDTYTPKSLFLQLLSSFLFVFFSLFFFWNIKFSYPVIFFFILIFLLDKQLLSFLFRREKKMLLLALPIIFFRNLVALIGLAYGIININLKLSK